MGFVVPVLLLPCRVLCCRWRATSAAAWPTCMPRWGGELESRDRRDEGMERQRSGGSNRGTASHTALASLSSTHYSPRDSPLAPWCTAPPSSFHLLFFLLGLTPQNIVHGDLKAENVLLAAKPGPDESGLRSDACASFVPSASKARRTRLLPAAVLSAALPPWPQIARVPSCHTHLRFPVAGGTTGCVLEYTQECTISIDSFFLPTRASAGLQRLSTALGSGQRGAGRGRRLPLRRQGTWHTHKAYISFAPCHWILPFL